MPTIWIDCDYCRDSRCRWTEQRINCLKSIFDYPKHTQKKPKLDSRRLTSSSLCVVLFIYTASHDNNHNQSKSLASNHILETDKLYEVNFDLDNTMRVCIW